MSQCRYIWNAFLQVSWEISTLKTMMWWIIHHPHYCLYMLLKFSFLICSICFYVKNPTITAILCGFLYSLCQFFLLCCREWKQAFSEVQTSLMTLLAFTQIQNKEPYVTRSEPDRQSKKLQELGAFTKPNKSVSTHSVKFSGKGSIFPSIKDKITSICLTHKSPSVLLLMVPTQIYPRCMNCLHSFWTHISLRSLEFPKWQIIQHASFVPSQHWIKIDL